MQFERLKKGVKLNSKITIIKSFSLYSGLGYGDHVQTTRWKSWNLIDHVLAFCDSSVLMFGNFNEILTENEKL